MLIKTMYVYKISAIQKSIKTKVKKKYNTLVVVLYKHGPVIGLK